jgi:protein TonB
MMKNALMIRCGCWLLLAASCVTPPSALENPRQYVDDKPAYKGRYAASFAPGEQPLRYGYYYIVSKRSTGFAVRVFHPDKKVLTGIESYSTPELNLLHGPCTRFWDDGSIREQGSYQFGRRHGLWLECQPESGKARSGMYLNDKRDGLWTQVDSAGQVEFTQMYLDGLRHGKYFKYDSTGAKVNEAIYRADTLVSSLFPLPGERLPILRECLDEADPPACTNARLREWMLKEMHFPQEARQAGLGGTVVMMWEVQADGRAGNLRIPHAVCDAFEDECRRIFDTLPPWAPGTIAGQPAKMTVTLPVKFSVR